MFNQFLNMTLKPDIDWPLPQARPAHCSTDQAQPFSAPKADPSAQWTPTDPTQSTAELETLARRLEQAVQPLSTQLTADPTAGHALDSLKHAADQTRQLLQTLLTPTADHLLDSLTQFQVQDTETARLVTNNIDLYLIDQPYNTKDPVLHLMQTSTAGPSVKQTLETVRRVARMVRHGQVPRDNLRQSIQWLVDFSADLGVRLTADAGAVDPKAICCRLQAVIRALSGLALTTYGVGAAHTNSLPLERALAAEAIGRGLLAVALLELGYGVEQAAPIRR